MEKKYEIKINIFQIFFKTLHSLLTNVIFWIWTIFSVGTFTAMHCFSIQEKFHLSIFLAPGITGLSFTLALIAATTRIFSPEDLAAIFLYENSDENIKMGDEYYDLVAPYFLSSILWVIASLLGLLDLAFGLNFYWIKFIGILTVAGGVLSLWQLFYAHMQDVTETAQRKIIHQLIKENSTEGN